MARTKKVKAEKIDGLSPEDKKKLRAACRQVWSWSHPRRLVIKRCLTPEGFSVCELCLKTCPKIYVDHIMPVGELDAHFIDRLFIPSRLLQGLCKKCHDHKTREERKK